MEIERLREDNKRLASIPENVRERREISKQR
jgi:hypothetical protein